jgi:MFS family permease
VVGALVLRDRDPDHELETETVLRTLGDTRLWQLSLGGGLYLYGQIAVLGFGVLFLHDEHGFSDGRAALVIAASQVLGAIFRIGGGRWSDVLGHRVPLLRSIGLAVAGALVVVAALAGGPVWLLVPALVLAGGLSMAWNGLAFTTAAELAGPRRSGAALGFQQTVLSGAGVAAPVLFAATVSAWSWPAGFALAGLFPLAGWIVLGPLRGH